VLFFESRPYSVKLAALSDSVLADLDWSGGLRSRSLKDRTPTAVCEKSRSRLEVRRCLKVELKPFHMVAEKSATVAEFGAAVFSPFSATVAIFCDSRTFLRRCGQVFTQCKLRWNPHNITKALSTLSQKSATVAENCETTATVAKFGDSRTFLRQCGQAIRGSSMSLERSWPSLSQTTSSVS